MQGDRHPLVQKALVALWHSSKSLRWSVCFCSLPYLLRVIFITPFFEHLCSYRRPHLSGGHINRASHINSPVFLRRTLIHLFSKMYLVMFEPTLFSQKIFEFLGSKSPAGEGFCFISDYRVAGLLLRVLSQFPWYCIGG